MRVLLAHFKIQDYGGIVNYSEYLARGLKANGVEVESVMLKNKGKSGHTKAKDRSLDAGWEYAPGLDLWMHQKTGWEGMYQFNYATRTSMAEWSSYTESYDLIVYVVPVPTCSKQNKEDDTWLDLFENTMANQVSVIHDGNMQKLYPHILATLSNLQGVICVHDAAFNSAIDLPVNSALIPNAHAFDKAATVVPINQRENGFVSMQTFKRWKRVDDLVRAIPYMQPNHRKIICGGGIEYHYMTSKTKCKAEYLDELGTPIWDEAIVSGMEYMGYVDTQERDSILSRVKLLIDPSWSHSYSKLGAHFNRVMVEAMSLGCVPVCTDLGMSNSSMFKAGTNYIEIPYNISPEGYAEIITRSLEDNNLLQTIQDNNLKLMSRFDCSTVAAQVVDFCFTLQRDDYTIRSPGNPSNKLIQDCTKKLAHFQDF